MVNDFLSRIEGNYYGYLVYLFGVLAVIFFSLLSREKKKKPEFLIPFLIVVVVFFYEFMGAFLMVNKSFNEKIHQLISNEPFQGWNLWVYNIFNYQVSKFLFLLLLWFNIHSKRKKNAVLFLMIIFSSYCLFLYVSPNSEITNFQPLLYFLGNGLIIIASGLFFIDLVAEDYFVSINPLTYWPFWYMTLILFQMVIVFLGDVAFEYLAFENVPVYKFFNTVSMVLYLLILGVFLRILFTGSNFIYSLNKK
ncbi:MAG: hypothetical protein HWE15_09615 [Algoriphagus sp.]|uniref:hypothetical protein n=1 Tax=Algoriphagus sp. TaxID=1872435 RepID=UPI001791F25E|nr:hypothetical protein [Algoriphagus sp.]NVJ86549.1 hypothetical protein [Algoriphagus sp.]